MSKNYKFALIGNSLKHSLSPKIHQHYAKIRNIKIEYKLLEIENLANFMENTAYNLDGFNVTFPFKIEIIPYLDEVSLEVLKIGSCNCVKKVNDKLIGYNSDYHGFKFYFDKTFNDKKFENVLVFGYGGAAKAICEVLKDLNLNFTVANRTLEKVDLNNKISLKEANLNINKYDLIINTTSCGYNNDNILTNFNLNKDQTLIDLNYKPKITPFLQTGINNFATTKNGLDMLIVQAMHAQDIWIDKSNFTLQDFINIKTHIINKKLVIDGFMGSGKSTFANYLNKNYIDLDDYIEKNENISIVEIFNKFGEQHFRKLEKKYFEQLMQSNINLIALGGGFSYNCLNTIQKYKDKILIIYINTNLEQVKENIQHSSRPLKNEINELFTLRQKNYQTIANITLNYKHDHLNEMLINLIKEL